MKLLNKEELDNILQLKTSHLISSQIADRQSAVILKGFNYLTQPENSVLYVADEVGLGKTYIAMGIASLLRHFSDTPETYQDVILVPTRNLQHKWDKELRQFITKNYLLFDNRVRSVLGTPVGEPIFHDNLSALATDHPAYHMYRTSSFSMGMSWTEVGRNRWFDELRERLSDKRARTLFESMRHDLGLNNGTKAILKKAYGYLLSICNPEIELLIVDEGHNFKRGLGVHDDDEVADRNNVVARFFGLQRSSEDDKKLFTLYPELKMLIRPKVQKLIILSATPKTESLMELKYQIDCFHPNHILTTAKTNQDVRERLTSFLIRGNMEYDISGKVYTRNLCRNEHRRGNVEIGPEAPTLRLTRSEDAIFMGLLQYKTIRHLGEKCGGRFELGMLAGFETFRVDQEKIVERNDQKEPEFEDVRVRKIRTAQDREVIGRMMKSYHENFKEFPPHPKQDALVNALFDMMLRREKSLVFVRRINSATELERRLLDRWEQQVALELSTIWMKKTPSSDLEVLIKAHLSYVSDRELYDKKGAILKMLVQRILDLRDPVIASLLPKDEVMSQDAFILQGLEYLFDHYRNFPEGEKWYHLLREQSGNIIKTELKLASRDLLQLTYEKWAVSIQNDIPEDEKEQEEAFSVDESYFFHSYLGKAEIKSFKSRMYSSDWFDVNFFKLNNVFRISAYNSSSLTTRQMAEQDSSEFRKIQEIFLRHLDEKPFQEVSLDTDLYPPGLVQKTTLLTELLIQGCRNELEVFINTRANFRRIDVFDDLKWLLILIRSSLRNGAGLLPLYIADKAKGQTAEIFLEMIQEQKSLFHHVLLEVRDIINDYSLLRSVNFPETDTVRQIETKLYYQSPVRGITGQSSRNRTNVATQFRMPGFPYVLVTTDIFREGEDLHTYCQNVYHYGIAWNCSDMEQRTGRIDRINSSSYRKMNSAGAVNQDTQLQVFYPYIQQTLEVSQVSKLFHSINSFVKTFNDFTEPIIQDGQAHTSEVVEAMPPVIDQLLRSKFEYDSFVGAPLTGLKLSAQQPIGATREELLQTLLRIEREMSSDSSFYYLPNLDTVSLTLLGDKTLTSRKNRRGPFMIRWKNDVQPGKFVIEGCAYLFRVSTRVQRFAKEIASEYKGKYVLTSIGEYQALQVEVKKDQLNVKDFVNQLWKLVEIADEKEELHLKGEDLSVFG